MSNVKQFLVVFAIFAVFTGWLATREGLETVNSSEQIVVETESSESNTPLSDDKHVELPNRANIDTPMSSETNVDALGSDLFKRAILVDEDSGAATAINSETVEQLVSRSDFSEQIYNTFPITQAGFELQSKFGDGFSSFESDLIEGKSFACADEYCLAEFSLAREELEAEVTMELMRSLRETPSGSVVYGVLLDEATGKYKYRMAYYPNLTMNL